MTTDKLLQTALERVDRDDPRLIRLDGKGYAGALDGALVFVRRDGRRFAVYALDGATLVTFDTLTAARRYLARENGICRYLLRWQGETVDRFDTLAEARAMRDEYNLAYRGGVTIKTLYF